MNQLEVGPHILAFNTAIGIFEYNFVVKEDGTCVLTETSKSYSDSTTQIKLAGEFTNCSIVGAKKFGANQYDISKTTGQSLTTGGFELASDGLIVKPAVLQYLYGTTRFEVEMSTGETLEFTLTNTKMMVFTNFNETDIWCWHRAPCR